MRRTGTTAELSDWLAPHLRWITLPSWVLSVAAHLVLWGVLLTVSRLPGCQPDAPGDSSADLRAVGLAIRPAPAIPQAAVEAPQPAIQPAAAAAAPPAVPDRPPVDLQLPAPAAPPVIGAGGLPRSIAGVDDILNNSRPTRGGPAAGDGGTAGETSFLGISDSGKRFVYVIDSSSSMADYGALRVAKSELLASLERLTETQQFQVLFANSGRITTLDAGRFGVFHGTDTGRLDVRQQAASVQPDAGTDHFAALRAGLKFEPDVLFYLSDAGEPPLTTADLQKLKTLNRGTRIHAIEFGLGAVSPDASGRYPPSFLTRLASENDGQYTYRDVTQFAGR
jgi:Ca-activated chloride channel family protein